MVTEEIVGHRSETATDFPNGRLRCNPAIDQAGYPLSAIVGVLRPYPDVCPVHHDTVGIANSRAGQRVQREAAAGELFPIIESI
jgi:hypothetical protein